MPSRWRQIATPVRAAIRARMNDMRIVDRPPSAGCIAVSYADRVPPQPGGGLSRGNAQRRSVRAKLFALASPAAPAIACFRRRAARFAYLKTQHSSATIARPFERIAGLFGRLT